MRRNNFSTRGDDLGSSSPSSLAYLTADMDREIKDKVTEKVEAAKKSLLCTWAELEAWQQDNAHILTGYRTASGSFFGSFKSLGYLHNESVNVYSHLIPAIAFAIVGYTFCRSLLERYEWASPEDVKVFACFFLGAVGCLGMSATYHLVSNHSHAVAQFGNKLDYLGIVSLIWGSFVPSIYYGFGCEPGLIKTYWTMITTIGLGCAIVSLSSTFRTPYWRPFRAGMFSAMGLSAVVPVLHGLKLYGVSRLTDMIGLPWLVLQGVLYLIGAATYAARIPERWKPGQYDIWGHSHQIFHVLVVLAAMAHLKGLIHAFDYHQSHEPFPMNKCQPDMISGGAI